MGSGLTRPPRSARLCAHGDLLMNQEKGSTSPKNSVLEKADRAAGRLVEVLGNIQVIVAIIVVVLIIAGYLLT
jgi:hypothetical protein